MSFVPVETALLLIGVKLAEVATKCHVLLEMLAKQELSGFMLKAVIIAISFNSVGKAEII